MKNPEIQEELYQSHIANEKVSASRTLCLLGSLLYFIFGIVDIYSLSIALPEVLAIRGGVLFVMVSAIAISYLKIFPKYYDLTIAVVYLCSAAGINAMIYLAQPGDHAANVYFAGLILVIMTVFSWAYFKFITSVIVISLILVSYAFVEIAKGMIISSLFVNVFFLVSAISIGYISQVIRDRYLRENFHLQQSLKKAVEEIIIPFAISTKA
jgi:hypothetical protein